LAAPGRVKGGDFPEGLLGCLLDGLSFVAVIGIGRRQHGKGNAHADSGAAGAEEGASTTGNRLPPLDGGGNLFFRNLVSPIPQGRKNDRGNQRVMLGSVNAKPGVGPDRLHEGDGIGFPTVQADLSDDVHGIGAVAFVADKMPFGAAGVGRHRAPAVVACQGTVVGEISDFGAADETTGPVRLILHRHVPYRRTCVLGVWPMKTGAGGLGADLGHDFGKSGKVIEDGPLAGNRFDGGVGDGIEIAALHRPVEIAGDDSGPGKPEIVDKAEQILITQRPADTFTPELFVVS